MPATPSPAHSSASSLDTAKMSDQGAPAKKPNKVWRTRYRRYRLMSWLALALSSLFFLWVLALVVLHILVLPKAQYVFERTAQTLARDYGIHLNARSVQGELLSLSPHLVIDQFTLRVNSRSAPITVDRIVARLSWRSVLGTWQFNHLQLDAINLALVRDVSGHIRLQGRAQDTLFDSSMEQGGGINPAINWLLRQDYLAINGLTINWLDQTQTPFVQWQSTITAQLSKQWWQTHIKAHIKLPAEVAESIEMQAQFDNLTSDNWRTTWGEWNINLRGVQWEQLLYFLPDSAKLRGRSEVALWSRGRGLIDAQVLAEVEAEKLQWEAFPLRVDKMRGRLIGQFKAGDLALDLRELSLSSEGANLPLPTLARVRFSANGLPQSGALFVPTIDLADSQRLIRKLIGWMPTAETLAKINPKGQLRDNLFEWSFSSPTQNKSPLSFSLSFSPSPSAGDAPSAGGMSSPSLAQTEFDFRYTAALHDLSWQNTGDIPGVSRLSGQIVAKPKEGALYLDSREVDIHAPKLLWQARHSLATLSGTILWHLLPQDNTSFANYRLDFSPLNMANRDGSVSLSGYYEHQKKEARTGRAGGGGGYGGVGPYINISATLLGGNGEQAWRYMPKIADPEIGDWLKSSIVGAYAPFSVLTLRGHLHRFPFAPTRDLLAGSEEVFQVVVPFNSARLQFQPDWPSVDDAAGVIYFDGPGMKILVTRGFLSGASAEGTQINIRDLEEGTLQIDGRARGPIEQFQKFMLNSPLHSLIPNLSSWRAKGKGELDLKLTLPLSTPEHSIVDGRFRANAASAQWSDDWPPFDNLNAEIKFDHEGVQSMAGTAQFLEAPLTLTPTPQRGVSKIDWQGLRPNAFTSTPFQHPWLYALSGTVNVVGEINLGQADTTLSAQVALSDLASQLPHPLQKKAGEDWHAHLAFRLTPPHASVSSHEPSAVEPNQANHAQLVLDLVSAPKTPLDDDKPLLQVQGHWRMYHGEGAELMALIDPPLWRILINDRDEALPSSAMDGDSGLFVIAQLRTLNVGDWSPLLTMLNQKFHEGPSWFRSAQINVDEVRLGARSLRQVSAQIVPPDEGASWQALVSAQGIKGGIAWQELSPATPSSPDIAHATPSYRVDINGQFVDLAELIPEQTPDGTATTPSVESYAKEWASIHWPQVSIKIDELRYKKNRLGLFEAMGAPTAEGYRFSLVRLSDNRLNIEGSAESLATTQTTQMNMKFELGNLGARLAALYGQQQLVGGNLGGQAFITWPGDWDKFSSHRLRGTVSGQLNNGRFLQIDPGVGRLLGLLSLQSIFRRITFDFSDTINQGFSFDSIGGTFQVRGDTLETKDLVINSPAAKVNIQGQINLARETQDIEMLVLPDISGGVSSGVAFFVSPFTGVATWLAQKVLGTPFDYLFARKLGVSGSWGEPQVVELPYVPNSSASPIDGVNRPSSANLLENQYEVPHALRNPDGFRAICR